MNSYDALAEYDSQDLYKAAKGYDRFLTEYLEEYRKVGIQEKRYPDIDAFVLD